MSEIKITKEMLEGFMSDKGMELTLAEIEALMDSEVEKPEDEMDTELVAMCADILAKAYNPGFEEGKPKQMYRPWEDEKTPAAESTANVKPFKKKAVTFRRALLVAAVLVLAFAVALPVCATLFDSKASDGIIQFYSDFFKINLNKDEPATVSESDTVNLKITDSLDSFMLPEAILSDDYEKSVRSEQNEYLTTTWVDVKNTEQNISGTVTVYQYKNAEHNMTNGQVNIPGNSYRYFKEILIDGKDIIVFGDDEKSYIIYSNDATNYEITLTCDFETTVSIAETIRVKG